MDFVIAVLGLFDATIKALLLVPLFRFLLCFYILMVAIAVFCMLKNAAKH